MSKYTRYRGKNKPHTIHEPETASLLAWLQAYPFMARNPLWFRNHSFSQQELKEVYNVGFQVLALELGYLRPLKANSNPYIVSIPSSTVAKAA